jgi:phospholipid/cholesterol/gamma-HCH transport system permease protein
MDVAVQTDRDGDHATLAPAGAFDLSHCQIALHALEDEAPRLNGCVSVDVDLTHLDRIDGTGAVLLAQLLVRLEAAGSQPHVVADRNDQAARLIALYRAVQTEVSQRKAGATGAFARIGAAVATLPGTARGALDFTGYCAAAVPKVITAPPSVDWRSLPMLIQNMGADALLVTSAANLLVGLIIGFIGVSQLGRFGAISFVPELVVVAHFRELGALVTAIVVAGRSGAGLASEIATMQVSEEIDALRSLGFDPLRWLVVPRCLALVIALPLLTWVGDVCAILGGLLATTVMTDAVPRLYLVATERAITGAHLMTGLIKTPFLALAIGLIACGQGLATYGGASAVGARTTTAVVLAIFSVIVINALFTVLFAMLGV